MPDVIPNAEAMLDIFTALRTARLLDLPGDELLSNLEVLASSKLPDELNGVALPPLAANQRSLHLAIAIVMIATARDFDPDGATKDFVKIRSAVLPAWLANPHTAAEKMRKTIDQALASGALWGRQGARDALLFLIWGDPIQTLDKDRRFVPGYMPRTTKLPQKLPLGGVEKFVKFLHADLVPNLDQIWGGESSKELSRNAFAGSSVLHADALRKRLLIPFPDPHCFDTGDQVSITSTPEGVEFQNLVLERMLPGARRTLRIQAGTAGLSGGDGRFWNLAGGQRLIIRALDDGRAHIQIARFNQLTNAVAGDLCPLPATLTFNAPGSLLEVWTCTCGTWGCDKKHRLTGWDPAAYPPRAKLHTFLMFAVLGPPAFQLGTFLQSMYYGLLSAGEET